MKEGKLWTARSVTKEPQTLLVLKGKRHGDDASEEVLKVFDLRVVSSEIQKLQTKEAHLIRQGQEIAQILERQAASTQFDVEKILQHSQQSAAKSRIQSDTESRQGSNSYILNFLFRDGTLDILVTRESVCLRCPLSFMRIRIPVKGIRCRHAQCFDKEV